MIADSQKSGCEKTRYEIPLVITNAKLSQMFFSRRRCRPFHPWVQDYIDTNQGKKGLTTIVPSQSLAPVEMSIKIGCLKISINSAHNLELGCIYIYIYGTSTLYTVPLLWYYKEPFIKVPSPRPHFCFGKMLLNGSFRARNPQVKWRRRGISCTKYHNRSKEKI